MCARRLLPMVGLLLIMHTTSASAQNGFGVELRAGATFAMTIDEASYRAPDFQVWPRELESAPRYELGLLLPTVGSRIRPRVQVSLVPGADVEGILLTDQALCPTCTDPFDGEVDRLEVMVGAEFRLFEAQGPVRPYADLGIGLRRYEFSYDAFIGTNGVPVAADSFSETELLGRFGLGVGLGFGSREITLQGTLHTVTVGAGTVPSELASGFGVDFGRERVYDVAVTVGLRQNF